MSQLIDQLFCQIQACADLGMRTPIGASENFLSGYLCTAKTSTYRKFASAPVHSSASDKETKKYIHISADPYVFIC